MNYSDPNFNVIVCGPGRTGSVFITSIFTTVTKLTPYQRLHNHNQEPMKAQECLHSHDIEDIKLMNEHTFFIASKRNMIDSTFSHQIAKSQDVWRYYERRPGTIKPFEVSI